MPNVPPWSVAETADREDAFDALIDPHGAAVEALTAAMSAVGIYDIRSIGAGVITAAELAAWRNARHVFAEAKKDMRAAHTAARLHLDRFHFQEVTRREVEWAAKRREAMDALGASSTDLPQRLGVAVGQAIAKTAAKIATGKRKPRRTRAAADIGDS